jgi:hypothetical protein
MHRSLREKRSKFGVESWLPSQFDFPDRCPVENTAVENKDEINRMARQRELLSLSDIAEETGISYATLRNYVIKYGDEIPSEGFGRDTRYPRPAIKVFQRLRKESKPGRKPANPLADPAPAASPAPQVPFIPAKLLRERPATPATPATTPAAPTALPAAPPMPAFATTISVDTSGIERELAAIRVQLERIADARVEALQRRNARLDAAASAAVAVPAAPPPPVPVAVAPVTPEAPAQEQAPALPEHREGIRDLETARNSSYPFRDRGRSRHAWPAAPGRKGPRPE